MSEFNAHSCKSLTNYCKDPPPISADSESRNNHDCMRPEFLNETPGHAMSKTLQNKVVKVVHLYRARRAFDGSAMEELRNFVGCFSEKIVGVQFGSIGEGGGAIFHTWIYSLVPSVLGF